MFGPNYSPVPVLFRNLFCQVFPASSVVRVGPSSSAFLFSVFRRPLRVLHFFSFGQVKVQFRFQSVPVNVRRRMFRALLNDRVSRSCPKEVERPMYGSVPRDSISAPIPSDRPQFRPQGVVAEIKVQVRRLRRVKVNRRTEYHPVRGSAPN